MSTTSGNQTPLTGNPAQRSMNLFNDFSFKYIFRRESHKDLLISFLNDLLGGYKVITEIEYQNSELQAESIGGRDCLFDLICTDQNKDKYLIEVQAANQNYITTRMLHYVSRLFSDGIEKGDKQYQNIKGVIGICITLFKMESPNFKTEYELIDNTDLSRKIDNFKIIFLQVPKISDTFEKCLSTTEQWIYIMRNINEIDSNIAQLRKEYEKLIDVSRMATLTEEERFNYFVAEHRLSCLIDSYETAKQDGRNDGLNEGREQGKRNEQIEIAKSLKQQNIDISIISNCTKLSVEEISCL